jgi:hypothetical protein
VKSHRYATIFVVVVLTGCASPYQGIKFRSTAPPIAEAYRSVTLALTVDGYTLRAVDPVKFNAETDWRVLPPKEKPETLSSTEQACRITLWMDERGKLYDVFLLPTIRTVTGGDTVVAPAPATHPLRLKWQRTLTTLLRKEQKEED